jgi:signal transduction histidine kinase
MYEFLGPYTQDIKEQKKIAETAIEIINIICSDEIKNPDFNKEKLSSVMNRIVNATDIEYICLKNKEKDILCVGKKTLSIPRLDTIQGEAVRGRHLLFWRTTRFADEHQEFRKGPVTILCLLNTKGYFKDSVHRGKLLLTVFILGFIGVTILLVAWSFSIRNRDLQLKLKSVQDRREQMEELSLAAAGLAHETKNPLGVIRGLAQQISEASENSSKARRMAGEIVEQADVTTARLGDFLSYARQRQPEMDSVNAKEHIERIISLVEDEFKASNIDLSSRVDDVCIQCDPEMLSQILLNLLMNSLKSMESGGKVNVALDSDGNFAKLLISDTGSGIPPELLPNIFKPYVSKRADGYGIGLAIVKRITEQSGWNIRVDSKQGVGTNITITGIAVGDKGDKE